MATPPYAEGGERSWVVENSWVKYNLFFRVTIQAGYIYIGGGLPPSSALKRSSFVFQIRAPDGGADAGPLSNTPQTGYTTTPNVAISRSGHDFKVSS